MKTQSICSTPKFHELRIWASIIDVADQALGCDSLGQHMVKALEGTATSCYRKYIFCKYFQPR